MTVELAAGANFVISDAKTIRITYEHAVGVAPGDLVIVVTSHHAAPAAWFAWPRARRLTRSGLDGADLALLHVLATERVAERFPWVISASGDAIFAKPAAGLRAAGCQITVVARPQTRSRRLAFAVRNTSRCTSRRNLRPLVLCGARLDGLELRECQRRRRCQRVQIRSVIADRVELDGVEALTSVCWVCLMRGACCEDGAALPDGWTWWALPRLCPPCWVQYVVGIRIVRVRSFVAADADTVRERRR